MAKTNFDKMTMQELCEYKNAGKELSKKAEKALELFSNADSASIDVYRDMILSDFVSTFTIGYEKNKAMLMKDLDTMADITFLEDGVSKALHSYRAAHPILKKEYSAYTLQAFMAVCDKGTDLTAPAPWSIDQMFNEDGRLDFAKLKDKFTSASEAELTRIVGLTNAVLDLQDRHEGLVQRNAYLLWAIDSCKGYQCLGYKNIATYAKEVLGINSKGSVSDAISTYQRFGETTGIIDWEAETAGQIRDKYRGFNFSTLMRMKKLSDDEIDAMGIVPSMSRSQVIQCINAGIDNHKQLEKKESEDKKAKDGSIEKEIDKELEKEKGQEQESGSTSRTDEQLAGEQELEKEELHPCDMYKITYRNGDNMDDFITWVAGSIRQKLEKAISGCGCVTLETNFFQNIEVDDIAK